MQISNDSLTSSNLPNSNRTNSSRKAGAPSSFHNVSHPQRDQAVVEVELESTQTLLQSRLLSSQPLTQALKTRRVKAFLASGFLVAVPVFIQAPLVRIVPTVSLAMTALWLLLGWRLLKASTPESELHNGTPETTAFSDLWGDLIIGFSWTWLAGAVYWGWFRADPYVHLPIESIGLPIVLTLLYYQRAKIGNYFYLGSLLGTAITDLYFYCVGLIPYWRALMTNPPESASAILHSALLRMETYQGVGCAIVLLTLLVMLGTIPLRSMSTKWWAFSGAVLSTILVDSLFFLAAVLA